MAFSDAKIYQVALLGSVGVGKSCLLLQMLQNRFFEGYDPTIEDYYRKSVQVDGETCMLDIFDTAEQEEKWTVSRDQQIRTREGFICVYSITSRESFEQIPTFIAHILRVMGAEPKRQVPILLVGNQCDLEGERQVSKSEGEELAKKYDCSFFETSAKDRINVEDIFFKTIRRIRKMREKPE